MCEQKGDGGPKTELARSCEGKGLGGILPEEFQNLLLHRNVHSGAGRRTEGYMMGEQLEKWYIPYL